MTELPEIFVPKEFNYIAAFLTFSCQLRCSYCINHHGGNLVKARRMSGEDWIKGLNRIITRPDLPITIQGGEPTVHKDFYAIVNGIRQETPLDLLTNLELDTKVFASHIKPDRFKRVSPYASIRVSYHHGQSTYDALTERVLSLQRDNYSIGIWEVGHPEYYQDVVHRQRSATGRGIDYRIKEFLGPWKGKNYGTMRYEHAVNDPELRHCSCRTSELLIAPDGHIFRCHSDLYANRASIGHILDPRFDENALGKWLPCSVLGKCSSCDTKLKTNRFQEFGHSSVEIKDASQPYMKNDEFVTEVVNTYGKIDSVKK